MKKKFIWLSVGLIFLLALAIGGYYYLKQPSFITQIQNTDTTIAYEITAPEEQNVYVTQTSLIHEHTMNEFEPVDSPLPLEITYTLTFTNQPNGYNIEWTNNKLAQAASRNLQADIGNYVKFIPYKKIRDNKLGIILNTSDKETLKKVEEQPEKAHKFISNMDTLTEYAIDFR
ncbi:hypothetical protein [Candidatus Enterococcus willemsii]|uniref:Uncharacterized protein n=1 Tax=Candidatus Enterococcus willemsii TaxID=1857215 RepID=A0ABQ6Z0E8_9ENTE|nr:hypothetical protein [Enterococcus sp. CU12B]KAF1304134.1 hypothetical protein BAU17_04365 [Enterococcus sp. CU12B]